MTPFPSDAHLASWAGICPGNNESAGKKRSGKTTKGSRWLRQALVQAAWAASHKKDSYFQAHARNLMHRRGRKRGLVAVAHSLLIVIYHMLKEGTDYRDLGPQFLDRLRANPLDSTSMSEGSNNSAYKSQLHLPQHEFSGQILRLRVRPAATLRSATVCFVKA